jgi:hypothetical protein
LAYEALVNKKKFALLLSSIEGDGSLKQVGIKATVILCQSVGGQHPWGTVKAGDKNGWRSKPARPIQKGMHTMTNNIDKKDEK